MLSFIKNYFNRKEVKKILIKLPRILNSRYGKGPYTKNQIDKTFSTCNLDQKAILHAYAFYFSSDEFAKIANNTSYDLLCREIQSFGFSDEMPMTNSCYYFDLGFDNVNTSTFSNDQGIEYSNSGFDDQ